MKGNDELGYRNSQIQSPLQSDSCSVNSSLILLALSTAMSGSFQNLIPRICHHHTSFGKDTDTKLLSVGGRRKLAC